MRSANFPCASAIRASANFAAGDHVAVGRLPRCFLIGADGQIRLALRIETGRHAERGVRGEKLSGYVSRNFWNCACASAYLPGHEQSRRALQQSALPGKRAGIIRRDFQTGIGQLAAAAAKPACVNACRRRSPFDFAGRNKTKTQRWR